MRERVNKPRAFLSHSSLDVPFIERIENDLRKCQIESWRDRNEIRDGQRWQHVIFEEGLPTCDVIIGYFTDNALTSDMVAKEVDAAQLRQLQDNGIAFLPYVNKEEIRSKLRLDIQSLHCRVWNDENYYEVFPSVVAEIWRSYMERTIAAATVQERNRRLEAELELEKLRSRLNASAFTAQEESEFQHIYTKLKEPVEVYRTVYVERGINGKSQSVEVGRCRLKVPFIEPLVARLKQGRKEFGWDFLNDFREDFASALCLSFLPSSLSEGNKSLYNPHFEQDLTFKLLILGLIKEIKLESQGTIVRRFRSYNHRFTEKMYRFVSWLDYYNKLGDKLSLEFIEFVDKSSYSKES
jgi:hypothetical protein